MSGKFGGFSQEDINKIRTSGRNKENNGTGNTAATQIAPNTDEILKMHSQNHNSSSIKKDSSRRNQQTEDHTTEIRTAKGRHHDTSKRWSTNNGKSAQWHQLHIERQ